MSTEDKAGSARVATCCRDQRSHSRRRASSCRSRSARSLRPAVWASSFKANTLTAIDAGVAVVIGTSGVTASDYAEIDQAARGRSVGVIASGAFSLTAAMCQAAALLAARHLPHWEVIDYASATKPDVPSGTARDLAERPGKIRPSALGHPVNEIQGPQEAIGATIGGTQVHSVRVPSFVVSTEVIFALPDSAS